MLGIESHQEREQGNTKAMTPDLLPQAILLHQSGRIAEAEKLYRTILNSSPRHADALNLLGVIAHQQGRFRDAIDLIGQAILQRGDQPAFYCNLAAAYCGLGRFDDAAASAESAIRLDPKLLDARLNLGLAHQGAKRWSEAERAFQTAIEQWPNDPRALKSLGDCRHEQGQIAAAVTAYQEALARQPDDGLLHLLVGTILATNNSPFEAEPHLRRAVELMPNSVTALVHLGACLTQVGKERDALPIFEAALRLQPTDLKAQVGMGQVFLGLGDLATAEDWFRRALGRDQNNAAALCGLAEVLRAGDSPDEAVALTEKALELNDKYQGYRILSAALSESGEPERSLSVLLEATRRFPSQADAWIKFGAALTADGQKEEAVTAYRQTLRVRPGHPLALARLAQILGKRLGNEERDLAQAALDQPAPIDEIASLYFGLAHVADELGDYQSASRYLRQANALNREYRNDRGIGYDPEISSAYTERIVATFTEECLARTSGFGNPSEQPVFVVGMPRSGTTLIEQIIASHPRAFGIGEGRFAHRALQRLPAAVEKELDPLDCVALANGSGIRACADWHLAQLQRVGRNADRIVDKMPENFTLLGWINILFPKARLIHCRRDLRDIALSCWMTNFSSVAWANDLHHIASRIKEYQRLMKHWEAALPGRILTVDYERLVTDQETESRRLIEWLGLEWEPACLEFHRTKRTVRTASLMQVRQPLYGRSIGRWRHYRGDLGPLLDELGLECE